MGVRLIEVSLHHDEANFGTRVSVRLIKGVRLIGGLLNGAFTVL